MKIMCSRSIITQEAQVFCDVVPQFELSGDWGLGQVEWKATLAASGDSSNEDIAALLNEAVQVTLNKFVL